MAESARGSINISGAGTVEGGIYENVSISGAGKVNGDVEAKKITTSGASELRGNVKTDVFKCSGASRISGSVEAGSFSASGAAHVGGDLSARDAKISGGSKIDGDVACDTFRGAGAFTIGGLLSADKVEIAIGNDSRIGEIGGETITIVLGDRIASSRRSRWPRRLPVLTVRTVEGDDLYLEAVHAEVVRGRRVRIGPGCRIRRVEYAESLAIDPDAQVDDHDYTGPGDAPPVDAERVDRPEGWAADHVGGANCWRWEPWRVCLGGREIRNPILRAIVAALGLLVGLGVTVLVLATVLPSVGLIVFVVLVGVAVLVLGLMVGIPVLVFGALVVKLLLLPCELVISLFRRPRSFPRTW